ncbi:MAG: UDP-N-acetylmuramoyl-tripeptide--D-alanyl-D-alanine ligase [bacterium]|nr:UDP-N-acetylmuramoyl-tripeptide--D-alanyl-D-alanine ligase [bacterium]
MLKDLLKFALKLMAQSVLWRHRPRIVAVTGSVGKTSTKDAISHVLSRKFSVWKSTGNYNNELGVPLTILGMKTGKRSIFLWLKVVFGFFVLMLRKVYPQILVLEMGADRKGDILYLCKIAKPEIAIVTRVGAAHLEHFGDVETVQREKAQLVVGLQGRGVAILNADDPRVSAMKHLHKGKVVTFGFSSGADVLAEDVRLIQNTSQSQMDPRRDLGLSFVISSGSRKSPLIARGILGQPQVYSLLAAFAVAFELGMETREVVSALESYQSPPGRLRPLLGIKRTVILDDTYNSSPEAAIEAMKILRQIRGKRRVAVLGDMLELGPAAESSHRQLGRLAKSLGVDLLLTVGELARFIADEARTSGFAKTKISTFDTADKAGLPLQNKMQEGDVVLIKGSRGMHMEKIVLEVMAEPEKAGELLYHPD